MPRGRGARRYRDRAFTLERAEYHTHTHTYTHALAHTHHTWMEDERNREFQLYHSFSQINVQLSNIKYCNYLMTYHQMQA